MGVEICKTMATNRGDNEERRSAATRTLVSLALGMGFSLLIFVAGGVLLDNVFHTTPVFMLIGVFFALASIVVFLWKIVAAGESK